MQSDRQAHRDKAKTSRKRHPHRCAQSCRVNRYQPPREQTNTRNAKPYDELVARGMSLSSVYLVMNTDVNLLLIV